MARAYGANIQVCAHFETVYGAPPSGDWIKLPIVSTTLGAEQPLIANAVLGLGREPVDPLRDVIRANIGNRAATWSSRWTCAISVIG